MAASSPPQSATTLCTIGAVCGVLCDSYEQDRLAESGGVLGPEGPEGLRVSRSDEAPVQGLS